MNGSKALRLSEQTAAEVYLLEENHGRGVGHIGEVHGGQALVQQAEGWGRGRHRGIIFSILSGARGPPQSGTLLHHPLLQNV